MSVQPAGSACGVVYSQAGACGMVCTESVRAVCTPAQGRLTETQTRAKDLPHGIHPGARNRADITPLDKRRQQVGGNGQ